MSRALCGQANVDGTPCRNGRGCTVDHKGQMAAYQAGIAAGAYQAGIAAAAAQAGPGADPLVPIESPEPAVDPVPPASRTGRRPWSSGAEISDAQIRALAARYAEQAAAGLPDDPLAALDHVQAEIRSAAAQADEALAREKAVAELRRLVLLDCQKRTGLTAPQLAERLGLPVETSEDKERSGSLVRQWLKDARDQRGERSDHKGGRPEEYADTLTKARLAELLISRQTVKEIADAYETSTTTVSRYLRKYGFSSRKVTEALSERTTPDRLTALADSEDELVRAAVAANPKSPSWVLEYLAGDSDPIVRRQVATNPSTPIEAVAALAGDHSPDVRAHAAVVATKTEARQ